MDECETYDALLPWRCSHCHVAFVTPSVLETNGLPVAPLKCLCCHQPRGTYICSDCQQPPAICCPKTLKSCQRKLVPRLSRLRCYTNSLIPTNWATLNIREMDIVSLNKHEFCIFWICRVCPDMINLDTSICVYCKQKFEAQLCEKTKTFTRVLLLPRLLLKGILETIKEKQEFSFKFKLNLSNRAVFDRALSSYFAYQITSKELESWKKLYFIQGSIDDQSSEGEKIQDNQNVSSQETNKEFFNKRFFDEQEQSSNGCWYDERESNAIKDMTWTFAENYFTPPTCPLLRPYPSYNTLTSIHEQSQQIPVVTEMEHNDDDEDVQMRQALLVSVLNPSDAKDMSYRKTLPLDAKSWTTAIISVVEWGSFWCSSCLSFNPEYKLIPNQESGELLCLECKAPTGPPYWICSNRRCHRENCLETTLGLEMQVCKDCKRLETTHEIIYKQDKLTLKEQISWYMKIKNNDKNNKQLRQKTKEIYDQYIRTTQDLEGLPHDALLLELKRSTCRLSKLFELAYHHYAKTPITRLVNKTLSGKQEQGMIFCVVLGMYPEMYYNNQWKSCWKFSFTTSGWANFHVFYNWIKTKQITRKYNSEIYMPKVFKTVFEFFVAKTHHELYKWFDEFLNVLSMFLLWNDQQE